MTERRLGTIRKNAAERIVIAETEFRGFKLLDIRSYAVGDHEDDLKPTRKGITVRRDLVPELIEALQRVRI